MTGMLGKPWEPLPQAASVSDLLVRKPRAVDRPCVRSGCAAVETWRCNYRDAAGNRCSVYVCPEHGRAVSDVLFCSRHARIVELLVGMEGSLFEFKGIPAVEDRAPTLVDEIAILAEQPILELLERRFQDHPEARVAADLELRPFGRGRRPLGWERGWSVIVATGFLSRVVLRVYSSRPMTVYALVDDLPVFQGVPGWVRNDAHRRPRTDKAVAGFLSALLEAIEGRLFPTEDPDA